MRFADLHCDTLTKFDELDTKAFDVFDEAVQVFAIYQHENASLQKAMEYIEKLKRHVKTHEAERKVTEHTEKLVGHTEIHVAEREVKLILSSNDLLCKDKLKAVLAIEGGEVINHVEDLTLLYENGVRMLTLTWNNSNALGGGCNDSSHGITELGLEIIKHMENLGMLIDLSHASEKMFWDVYRNTTKSFVCSHSNCKHVCNHKRNLTDSQILAVKNRNGLIGLNMYSTFLTDDDFCTLNDLIRHVEHLLKLLGTDCICFGCDFDGCDKLPREIENVTDMQKPYNLFQKLYGYKLTDKLFFENAFNFLKRTL